MFLCTQFLFSKNRRLFNHLAIGFVLSCTAGLAQAGAKMLMLDQQTKRADIPHTSLSDDQKPRWLGNLAFDPGYFKVVAHTYVVKGAEGDMFCGFIGDSWVKEQSSILITATARGIDTLPNPVEVPIYTRDATSGNPVCTGSELSVVDVIPFTPMKDLDDFGAIRIAFKYSNNKSENLSNLATQTLSVMQAFTPVAAAAAITTPLSSSAMQTMSSSYGKIAGTAATDWVTLPIDYRALREGIDSWSVTVQMAERGFGSSFTDIINNPEKYKNKIRPVLRMDFKVVYAPSVFTRDVELRSDEVLGTKEYWPRINPTDKNIIAPPSNGPVSQPSLLQKLNMDTPSPMLKLAREASGPGPVQTGCDEIRRIIDAAPLTLPDRAIWYNAALMQINDSWGTDPKFMKSNCITAGARDYATVLDKWFPGLVNIIKLSDVEYARRSSRTFTQTTQNLFPDFAHALLQTQNAPQQAEIELKNLLDSNVILRPMTNLFADNLNERRGFAEVAPALSAFKVKSVGCFYQAAYQVGQNEGFLIYTLDERDDALRVLLKFNANKITEITLQDLNTSSYKNEVIDKDWQTQSSCKTQIVPALQAVSTRIATQPRKPLEAAPAPNHEQIRAVSEQANAQPAPAIAPAVETNATPQEHVNSPMAVQ
jgi:hypothetical protein